MLTVSGCVLLEGASKELIRSSVHWKKRAYWNTYWMKGSYSGGKCLLEEEYLWRKMLIREMVLIERKVSVTRKVLSRL